MCTPAASRAVSRTPDASHLRGDQERQEEVLAAHRRSLGARRRKGFNQTLDYLPLNGAEIVIRAVEEDTQADGNGGAQ
jgi:hypothetical protein